MSGIKYYILSENQYNAGTIYFWEVNIKTCEENDIILYLKNNTKYYDFKKVNETTISMKTESGQTFYCICNKKIN